MLTSLRRFPSVAEDASTYARRAKYVCQRFHHAGRNILLYDHMFWRLQRHMWIWQYAQRHNQDMSVDTDVRIPLIAFCTWLLGVGSHITTSSTIRPDGGNRCFRILVAMRLNICSALVSGMSWHNIYTHGNEETTATLILISTLVLMLQNKAVWQSTSKKYAFIVMTNCLCYRIINFMYFGSLFIKFIMTWMMNSWVRALHYTIA